MVINCSLEGFLVLYFSYWSRQGVPVYNNTWYKGKLVAVLLCLDGDEVFASSG